VASRQPIWWVTLDRAHRLGPRWGRVGGTEGPPPSGWPLVRRCLISGNFTRR